jgi:hypothetical protein
VLVARAARAEQTPALEVRAARAAPEARPVRAARLAVQAPAVQPVRAALEEEAAARCKVSPVLPTPTA